MEFTKVMEIKVRMCLNKSCSVCPLSSESNGKGKTCGDFIMQHPSKAEQILIEWDKAHSVKTFLSDFLEKYPNAPLDDNGAPDEICPHMICPNMLGYTESDDCTEFCGNCPTCWNRPLEVEK